MLSSAAQPTAVPNTSVLAPQVVLSDSDADEPSQDGGQKADSDFSAGADGAISSSSSDEDLDASDSDDDFNDLDSEEEDKPKKGAAKAKGSAAAAVRKVRWYGCLRGRMGS